MTLGFPTGLKGSVSWGHSCLCSEDLTACFFLHSAASRSPCSCRSLLLLSSGWKRLPVVSYKCCCSKRDTDSEVLDLFQAVQIMMGVINIGVGLGRTSTRPGDFASLGAAYWLGSVVKFWSLLLLLAPPSVQLLCGFGQKSICICGKVGLLMETDPFMYKAT